MSREPESRRLDDIAPLPGGVKPPLQGLPDEAYGDSTLAEGFEDRDPLEVGDEKTPSEDAPEGDEEESEEPEEEPSDDEDDEEEDTEPSPKDEEDEDDEDGEVDAGSSVPGPRFNKVYGRMSRAEREAEKIPDLEARLRIADDRADRATVKVQEWQGWRGKAEPVFNKARADNLALTGQVGQLSQERDMYKDALDAVREEHGIDESHPAIQKVALASMAERIRTDVVSSIQPSLDELGVMKAERAEAGRAWALNGEQERIKTEFDGGFRPILDKNPDLGEFGRDVFLRWAGDSNLTIAQASQPFLERLLLSRDGRRKKNVGAQNVPKLPKGGRSAGAPKKRKIRGLADATASARDKLNRG